MTEAQLQKILAQLEDHEKRIHALEGGTIRSRKESRRASSVQTREDYSGATGGIRFLIKNGLFKMKTKQKDIRKELADKSYHYSSQAIYEALKILSRPSGPLVVLNEKRQKVYVERK